ncbi:hypothetical protein CC86DRAFT_383795 [Ophiobolus disseminans]|uniref:Uncharacterized protein n=1 Tax=Ophiobolus disseminans TaxID=1469910 RepID=A0A6A6ZTG0_9PLEO|nr:hypothetical protein CC86DRAFT_383795 [Ophiobolus disseminans]
MSLGNLPALMGLSGPLLIRSAKAMYHSNGFRACHAEANPALVGKPNFLLRNFSSYGVHQGCLVAIMVDQNANSPQPIPEKPLPSGKSSVNEALTQPTVIKSGEAMLIISLVLIFLVCCTVATHLFLRRRKRRRGGAKKEKVEKKGKKAKAVVEPEAPKEEKHIAELVGTPMCELGESDPRHEMEDAEVDERHLQPESETSSCHKSEIDPSESESETASYVDIEAEAGISWYDDSEERVEPGDRDLAMYWARGM